MSEQFRNTGGRHCAAWGCPNSEKLSVSRTTGLPLRFHTFPSDLEIVEKWKERLHLKEQGKNFPLDDLKRLYKVCSDHFEAIHYNCPEQRYMRHTRLVWNAVPTIVDSPGIQRVPQCSNQITVTLVPPVIFAVNEQSQPSPEAELAETATVSVKNEPLPMPTDVISFHQQKHGVSNDISNRSNGVKSVKESSEPVKISANSEDNWQIAFKEIPTAIFVPCLHDFTENITLISVRVANTKICSVFPNIDQASKEFEDLKKPLTTRSIKYQSVIDIYNRVIQHDCAHEYGPDFELTVTDKFVLFEDFKCYYGNVQKAFPSIWQDKETTVPQEEINVVQGGMLELGHLPCPYISRGSVMLLPTKIVRIAAKGLDPSNDALLVESVPILNGWPASPREIAFLTHICCTNNIPLMFGRDTRLLPLSQISCLFNDRIVIGNSIEDGKKFSKPQDATLKSNGGGEGKIQHSIENGVVFARAVVPTVTQQLVTSLPFTTNASTAQLVSVNTTLPPNIQSTSINTQPSVSDNRTVVLQNIGGMRWITAPTMQVMNIQSGVQATTSNGEKRRRLDTNSSISNVRNSQAVGCS